MYVRFKDVNGAVSGLIQDDIILDQNPPTGSVSIAGSGASGLSASGQTVTLSVSAEDDVSGVGEMRLSNWSDLSGAPWEPYAASRTWTVDSTNTVYVQFRDKAANVSQIYSSASAPVPARASVFLPIVVRGMVAQ